MLAVRLHLELLQVRREAREVLVVRQHGEALGPQEVRVPDPAQGEERGQVAVERGRAEVLVHLVEPARSSRKRSGPIAIISERPIAESSEYRPPTQSQNSNMFSVSIPNSATSLGVRGDRDEVLRDRRLVAAQLPEQPVAGRPRVRERLDGRERLRRDDEERRGGIEVARRLDEVGPVDVRDEPVGPLAVGVLRQRAGRHRGAEVGAADADVHHGPDRLAGVAAPFAAAHAIGERSHAVEHGVHLGTTSSPSTTIDASSRRAQRHVQHRRGSRSR